MNVETWSFLFGPSQLHGVVTTHIHHHQLSSQQRKCILRNVKLVKTEGAFTNGQIQRHRNIRHRDTETLDTETRKH